jgi:predicted Holliday junction resolvase-like endonuclease
MTLFSLDTLPSVFLLLGLLFVTASIGYFLGRFYRSKFVKDQRNDAIDRSKSVILWEVYEKIYPLLPECPYAPRDMVFLWKGVDYIVFDWLAEGNLKKIVFLEVKSWRQTFSKNERMIRGCIEAKHVSYSVVGKSS